MWEGGASLGQSGAAGRQWTGLLLVRGLCHAIVESLLGPWLWAVCSALFLLCDSLTPLRTLVCCQGASSELLPPDPLFALCCPPGFLPSELEVKLQMQGH